MQRKQSEDCPRGGSHTPFIQRGSRVCEKSNELERGTVIKLGTQANGWAGYAWIKFDRRSGRWVDLTHLEILGMPASEAQPVAGKPTQPNSTRPEESHGRATTQHTIT